MVGRIVLCSAAHAALTAALAVAAPALAEAAWRGDAAAAAVLGFGALVVAAGLRVHLSAVCLLGCALLRPVSPRAARRAAAWAVALSPRLLRVAAATAVAGSLGAGAAAAQTPAAAPAAQATAAQVGRAQSPAPDPASPGWPLTPRASIPQPTAATVDGRVTSPGWPLTDPPASTPTPATQAASNPATSKPQPSKSQPSKPAPSSPPASDAPGADATSPGWPITAPHGPGTPTAPADRPSTADPSQPQHTERETRKADRAREPHRTEGERTSGRKAGPRGHGHARRTVVVVEGDSLWSIAQRTAPTASTAQTARRVAELYRANRARIGPDPDLILPGQRLDMP